MKHLFNNKGKGSTELKELLGFLDVDIKYNNLRVDLEQATKEVRAIVGQSVIDKAIDIYLKDDATIEELEYLRAVRLPIAIRGYALYVPNGDISHTNNGRRMRFDDTEKQAFEWLLDRDNEALERKYYRALDSLLELLEEDEEFQQTEIYQNLQKSLFVTTEDFKEFFSLDSRLLLMKLQPGIKQCIQKEIKPRLTEEQKAVLTNDPLSLEADLLHIIKAACAYYALAWALPRLSVNMFAEGILQVYASLQTTKSKKVPEKNEIAWAKQCFEDDFKHNIEQLESMVKTQLLDDEQELDFKVNTIIGTNFLSL